jgi:hypothetical protein
MSCLHKTICSFQHSTAHYVRIFRFSQKRFILKVVHPLKIYQNTKFHGPTLIGASFAPTSKV